MSFDLINGLFEFGGGILLIINCWRLYQDKMVRGVSIWVTVFFTAWGLWNLAYYPYLGQWLSFGGGIFICAVNFLWVAMAFYGNYKGKAMSKSTVSTFEIFAMFPDAEGNENTRPATK